MLALPTDRRAYGDPVRFTENRFDSRDWIRPMAVVSTDGGSGLSVFGNWFDDGLHDPEEALISVALDVDPTGIVRPLHNEPRVLPALTLQVGGVAMGALVSPGANSALHVPAVPGGQRPDQTFVFVRREPYDLATKDRLPDQEGVALWYADGQGNQGWLDLGTPVNPPSEIVGSPVAFTWFNQGLNQRSVNMFVVARRGEGNQRYELYERYWSVDGNSPPVEGWQPWKSHGSPRWDPYDASKGQLLEPDTRFRMTNALVWELDGTTRVNVFGFTNPETDRDGVDQPRRLVEYVWDGANWTWGFHHEPPPSGLGVRSLSSAWTDKNGAIRISLACRTTDGGILERYYQIDENGWAGWFWNDLTN